ncbi:hypothetical protein M3181_14080 [Mesobacillus maritimus]|uniref:hypothetical protein n=1 Tax=Mesobacillus maritimus TaxID=1643336 RepID=UPI00203E8E1F|nr:hypothetical protein [Mesobacillus maritimus]MCM3670131.1 hypothetical protein [Mesobacillus maritimus]
MLKKAFVWPLIFTLFILLTHSVAAEENQNPLQMEELTIQVMPEFAYHPEDTGKNKLPLLVGYHGALINNSEQPQRGQIEIPLPMEEENFRIGFVADYSSDLTEMNEIEYELDQKKGTITWTTTEDIQPQELYRFVIEYYTNSIHEGEKTNTLEYSFKSYTDIGMLNLIFVEPLNTESMKLEPEAESHQKNSYNMNMFIYMSNGVKPGEEKNIKLEYDRAEERTTEEVMNDMVGGTSNHGVTATNNEKIPVWMIVTVIGGVSIVIAAVLLVFLRKRSKKSNEKGIRKESALNIKKAKLRALLVDGTITEQEYIELLKKVGGEK